MGDVASKLALESFGDAVWRLCQSHIKNGKLALNEKEANLILSNAVTIANNRVVSKHEEVELSEGMGTTLVAALILDGGRKISWANVGDSRLYTVDSRDILQVTKDHSYIQYMIDLGKMTLEEAKKSKKRNLITRAVGIDLDCKPDIDTFPLSAQEIKETTVILCSDGFSNAVSEEECSKIVLTTSLTIREKVETLIELAKKNNGSDNITLIMVKLG